MSLSIFEAANDAPRSAALVSQSGVSSYAELAEHVEATLRRLERRGLSRSDPRPVALIASPTEGSIEILLALVESAVTALLIHPRLTAEERSSLLSRCPVQLLVDGASERIERSSLAAPVPSSSQPALAIVPTSGTSGAAKLVALSREAFLHSARASQENLGISPEDRWLLCLPLAHVGGMSIVTRCVAARACVVLFDDPPQQGRAPLAETFARQRVSLASLVPTQLEQLLDLVPTWQRNPELRAVLLGGAAPSAKLVNRAETRDIPVLPTYGLTETCSQVTARPFSDLAKPGRPIPRFGSVTSSGRALSGFEVRVVEGVIQVRGPTLCDRYVGDEAPERTADGFLVTRDRGHLDETGELFVLGRTDDLIISGGEDVDPLEVEAALCTLPGVRKACVFGVKDPSWGERVAAALVLDSEKPANQDQIIGVLRGTLAPFKCPRLIAFVNELPLTASGKVDRGAARRSLGPLLRPVASR